MRIGIFGGTFDPPHIGHLILAAEAYDQLQLDLVLWVLTPRPPHKIGRPIHPVDIRLELLSAAIEDNPKFELSRVDLDRTGPHYSVDTITLLKRSYPNAILVFLVGGDSFHDLPSWHEPQNFIDALDEIGVMRRPGDAIDPAALETSLPGISKKTRFIHSPMLDVSSSDIRARISGGRPFRYFLPEKVYEKIVQDGLYQDLEQDRMKTHDAL